MALATAAPSVPPMPGRIPLAGHAVQMFRNPLRFFQSVSEQGGLVRIWLGTKQAYVVSDHDMLYDILVRKAKSFEKGMQFDQARPLLGNGILLSEGDFHRRQRLLMQPAFHHEKIGTYVDVMRESATDVFGTWRDGQRVGMYNMFYELAVRIVIKALFSTDMVEQDVAEVYKSMPVVISGVEKRAAIPPALLDRIPTQSSREFHSAIGRLYSMGRRIIADYRAKGASDQADDLMTLLFAAQAGGNKEMTDKQIQDEFMTLLTAGSETTPSAMSWTCMLLGRHPEVQRRMQEEVDKVVGDRPVEAGDLRDLDYTRRVIQEALRMYPPVWALGRKCVQDTELGGHLIPAGTEVLYSIYAVHHDPKTYDNPEAFDPDRWLPERAKQVPRSAFMPFGAGVRNCIGESFSWFETQTVLATLMQQWSVQPITGEPVKPIAMGALVPGELPMKVVRRVK
ncbi:cytochrome P450 [Streptomyces flaveolus]|jgi:cytochrome P450|uniref:Cytochrome P450 n=2 Tax=Streptomyces flaveolus TaxID=67297 RepID=A0ABV1VAG9_9ACTN|nr:MULTISPECIES: cytochrome P450 [Streptomyces]MCG8971286.1 cytochrome P450 [Streptomyces sp. CL12-4]